jgi:hypothetical protein
MRTVTTSSSKDPYLVEILSGESWKIATEVSFLKIFGLLVCSRQEAWEFTVLRDGIVVTGKIGTHPDREDYTLQSQYLVRDTYREFHLT